MLWIFPTVTLIGEKKYIPKALCTISQKKQENNAQKDTDSPYDMLRALTWFLGCDIDYVALWAHSSAVIGPQGHVIGAAALQIPDE